MKSTKFDFPGHSIVVTKGANPGEDEGAGLVGMLKCLAIKPHLHVVVT